jgi:peptidoglycan hydrolase-like protein with peptidoglycan-binding domain
MPTSERDQGQPFSLPEGKTPLEEAQALLIILGYDVGAAEGKMGEKTKAALQEFSASEGLAFDGNISDDLISRLRKRANGSPSSAQVKIPAAVPPSSTGDWQVELRPRSSTTQPT